MEYYGNNDWRDYSLTHHGILGMKWGVMNGPPYPLDSDVSTGKRLRLRFTKDPQTSAMKAIENNASGYSTPKEKIDAVTADCWVMNSQSKNSKDKKRAKEAAELGVDALIKMKVTRDIDPGTVDYFVERGYSKKYATELVRGWKRDWFLYEDQTTGLPMIADLINQGYTDKQVAKMIDIVNENRESLGSEGLKNQVVFGIRESSYNDRNKTFATTCYEIKNSKKK